MLGPKYGSNTKFYPARDCLYEKSRGGPGRGHVKRTLGKSECVSVNSDKRVVKGEGMSILHFQHRIGLGPIDYSNTTTTHNRTIGSTINDTKYDTEGKTNIVTVINTTTLPPSPSAPPTPSTTPSPPSPPHPHHHHHPQRHRHHHTTNADTITIILTITTNTPINITNTTAPTTPTSSPS